MTQYLFEDQIKNKMVKDGNKMVLLLLIQVLSRQAEDGPAEAYLPQSNQDQKG